MKKVPKWFKILFIISIIGGGYLIGDNYFFKKQFRTNGESIKATITNMEDFETVDEGIYARSLIVDTRIEYKFTYEGNVYIGSDMWLAGEFYTMNLDKNSIIVEFINDNPKINRLKKSKEFQLLTY